MLMPPTQVEQVKQFLREVRRLFPGEGAGES